jgi:GWxTD domain-containing protein
LCSKFYIINQNGFILVDMVRVFVIFFVLILVSCGSLPENSVQQNTASFRRDGYPEVRIYTLGLVNNEGKPAISTFIEIEPRSIVTIQSGKELKAELSIELIISGKFEGVTKSFSSVSSIDLADEIRKKSGLPYVHRQQFETPVGEFRVVAQITDAQSGKTATVASIAHVPNPKSDKIDMSDLALLVKDGESFEPFIGSMIPRRFDSLQLYSQVFPGKQQLKSVRISLSRLPSDSLPARRLFDQNYIPGQLGFKGVDFDEETIVETTTIPLKSSNQTLLEVTSAFSMPSEGIYRFSLELESDSVLEKTSKSSILFSVRSSYFPFIRTPRELAEPLFYLMDDDEYSALLSESNPDTIKKKVDLFWLKNLGSARLARQSIQLYYERVEEANKRFTTFKEGWKTDPGMIYILLGSPKAVDQNFRDILWAYGMYQNPQLFDPEQTFVFTEVLTDRSYFPYEHYLLRRSQNYFQIQRRIIEDWLTGYNLRAN